MLMLFLGSQSYWYVNIQHQGYTMFVTFSLLKWFFSSAEKKLTRLPIAFKEPAVSIVRFISKFKAFGTVARGRKMSDTNINMVHSSYFHTRQLHSLSIGKVIVVC